MNDDHWIIAVPYALVIGFVLALAVITVVAVAVDDFHFKPREPVMIYSTTESRS